MRKHLVTALFIISIGAPVFALEGDYSNFGVKPEDLDQEHFFHSPASNTMVDPEVTQGNTTEYVFGDLHTHSNHKELKEKDMPFFKRCRLYVTQKIRKITPAEEVNTQDNEINEDLQEYDDDEILDEKENGGTVNNPQYIDRLTIRFHGKNDTLEIYEPCSHVYPSTLEFYGENCHCTLNQCQLSGVHLLMQHQAQCFVDKGATIGGYIHLANERNLSLKIGKACMFSGDTAIWATDGHIIKNKATGETTNRAKNGISIGDHCWIGHKAMILKNTVLQDNTIVGAMSVVSGKFNEGNIIIAGNPARKIRDNVEWDRKPLD